MYHSLKSAYGYAVRNHFEDTRFRAQGCDFSLPTKAARAILRDANNLTPAEQDTQVQRVLEALEQP